MLSKLKQKHYSKVAMDGGGGGGGRETAKQ